MSPIEEQGRSEAEERPETTPGTAEADDEAREQIRELERADEVPSDPADWPGGQAKYVTFGGGEGQSDDAFGEGTMAKLGPGDVHYQEDGSVIVKGEKVDDPDEYKGEPIPGGPTDPNAPKVAGERDLVKRDGEGASESESDREDAGEKSADG
jgi:hypothetical protein